MNNQKKSTPVKISKRFLSEQAERKNFIGLIEKYDLIISIMEHLTLSRKKSSSTFLEKASQIMSNEELNDFALKTYNILESAVVMWNMIGKGRDSAERNKIIRKRVYDSLNSLSSSETLSPTHAKSALGARSYGYYGRDPERTAYTKISEMKRRIIANTNANDKNTSYFFRYLFKALNPALFDEKTESETDFEKYSVFNNLSKLKSIDEAAAKVLKDFIFVSWLEEGDVVEFYLRHKQSIENSLITLIKKIKDKDFDNQMKANYLKLVFSVVNYIWDHFLPDEYYPHPGPHYYLQDISDNIFSDYEEGIYDYYKELLKENKNIIKEGARTPVRVSKRFLNEGLLRAGPIRFDFNNASMLSGGYSAQGLPAQGKPVTSKQLSNLRGAMIVRSMIESDAATVASISEDFAADLIGGENTNSRAFGGDNSKFSDVVVGNKYYSVKFRKNQKSNEFSQHKTDVFVKAMEAYGKNNEYGVILIDADPQRGGRNGAGFSLYVSPTIRGSDVRLEKNVRISRQEPHNLFIGERAVGISNSFRTKKKIKEIFKGGEDININIATIEEINESINRLYEKDVDKSLTRGSGHDAAADRSYFIINGKFDPMSKFISLIRDTNKSASNIIQVFPFFGKGLGAASARADIFIKSAGSFLSNDEDGDRREFVYTSSRLFKQIGTLMKFVDEYPGISKELKKELIKYYLEELKKITLELEKTINMTSTSPGLPLVDNSNLPGPFGQLEDLDLREAKNLFENKIKKINLKFAKLLLKEKKNRKKRSKCTPARRRIASGGKAGSYADPRTGGKQAYAALKKAKPPGSKGGWTKKKCICCHKCPNDRSAPNGFVCTNPSHLYWGTKADNTYDQNRGNGWAARNKNKNEGDPKGEKAFSHEIMVSEDKIRDAIKKIILEDAQSESWFGNSFVAFKKEVSKGKDPLKVAKKNLNEIGRGSTRVVFDLPDNDGFVLKIINTEVEPTRQAFIGPDGNVMSNVSPEGDFRTRHGFFRSHMRQSNEWEADLVMQQKFPDVFPKTFEKADDFSWILVEKALPIATLNELIDILGVTNTFSSSARNKKVQFIAMIKEAIEYFKNPDHRLRVVNESYDSTITGFNFDDKTNKETFSTDLFDVLPTQNNQELPSDTIRVADDEPYTPVEDPHDKRVKELISNAHNRKILGAMADLGIPPREFLPKNLGISSLTGKLLIIDASLWEEKKKVR